MSSSSSPWIEIDLDAIAHNTNLLRQKLQPSVRLLAAVKSNGYGHGAAEVAGTVLHHGASMLGVARLEEGVTLRQAGIGAPILIFGPVSPTCAWELLQYGLTPTVVSHEDARRLSESLPEGRILRVHVKIDTGMGRLGCCAQAGCRTEHDRAMAVADEVACIAGIPNLHLDGVFTHFACADAVESDRTAMQLQTFLAILALMSRQGVRPPLRHAANSAAILHHPQAHLDLVRAGIALYGYGAGESSGLRPAMTLKARIVQLKRVPAGTTVSYGMTCRTASETTVATVALGYGDGYSRAHSGRGRMLVRGRLVPILGRVCMDLTMLDVGDVPGVSLGDEVVAFGQQGPASLPVDVVAAGIGTIPYEVVSALTARVRRVFRCSGSARTSGRAAWREVAA